MNIPELFIRRPIMTTLITSSILIFGAVAYRFLPVSDLPNVDRPTIQVFAFLPGASPETMASAVATPLERQFSTIAGLDSMSSANTQGQTTITLQFNLRRNIDAAAQDVQSMVSQAEGQLPQGMPTPPSFRKVNPADQPILYMAVSSATLPLSEVTDYADTRMAQRISMVSGVAQVQVFGAQKFAVRVQFDPKALAARQIGIDEAVDAIRNANVNLPTGTLYGRHKEFTVEATGQLMNAAAFRPLIVAYRNASPVHLEELANVVDGAQTDKIIAWYLTPQTAVQSMVIAVQKQPGTNTVEVVDNVNRLLPAFRREMPAGIHLDTIYDRSLTIRGSVSDVKFTLYLTIALVVMVIFLFLRNLSATIIPSLALPFSIVGTFAVMYLLGYTVDNLSLMALTLSVGFVVDDAIVMLENIVRHLEMGKSALQAALDGSREIGFTILSMTLSLAAVFIPVLFMGGMLGRLLHEFAVTIAAAILVSGFVSLTLTPMLCSRFLRHQPSEHHGALFNLFERGFQSLLGAYDHSLRFVLRHRLATLTGSLLVAGATAYLFVITPMGFLPSEDTGFFYGFTMAAQGISFDSMKEHQQKINAIFQAEPNLDAMMSMCPLNFGGFGSNTGIFFAHLKPHPQRRLSTDEVIQELAPKLMSVPGMIAFLQNPPPIQIGGQLTKSRFQFALQGTDTEELYPVSNDFLAKMSALPGLQDVNTDLQIKNPQVNVRIDRAKASALGVSAYQIEDALATAYGERQVSTIYTPRDEYWVITEVEAQYQTGPDALPMLYVRSSSGKLVPLAAVASIDQSLGPLSVNHYGQLPSVTISFGLRPGVALGDAVKEVENLALKTLPVGISHTFQGEALEFQSSLTGLGLLIALAILVIYIVLGVLYESFIHPITILSGLPSAGFGALVTLILFSTPLSALRDVLHSQGFRAMLATMVSHTELNLYCFVGIIMLIGIVKKNAIMMIDFALEAQRNEGKAPIEAIYQGCLIRFRPIMMTTMAALMGTLPIAIGFGASAQARRPLGLSVVGGLVVSQLITLYITPVYYTYLDSLQRLFRGKGAEGPLVPEPALDGPAEPEQVEIANRLVR